jgi:hypothetical protein
MRFIKLLLKDFFQKHRPLEAGLPPAVKRKPIDIKYQRGGQVIAFCFDSGGDALKKITWETLAPLEGECSAIRLIDLRDDTWIDYLEELLCEPVWFACSYFGPGEDLPTVRNGKNGNLWDLFGIPFVRFYGDMPVYCPERHVSAYLGSVNVYFDPAYADFYSRWFPTPGLTKVLPPLMYGVRPLQEVDVSRRLKGKIVFAKNGNSPEKLMSYWKDSLSPTICNALAAIAEIATSPSAINDYFQLDVHIVNYFRDIDIDISRAPDLVSFMVAQLDDFLRRYKSTMIAEAILDLPVLVCGENWEHVKFEGRRAQLDPVCDFSKTQAMFDEMLAMVDMSPNSHYLIHDRVCRAVGQGTAFLTNHHKLLDATLSNVGPYAFDFNKQSIQGLVEHYIDNPGAAIELGLAQSVSCRDAFKASDFAEKLKSLVDVARMRCGGTPSGTQEFVFYPSRFS